MNGKMKQVLFQEVKKRYHEGDRQTKRLILDELMATTGHHRKAIIRRLNMSAPRRPRHLPETRRRPPRVTSADMVILKRVVPAMGWPCGKRLVAMLPLWLGHVDGKYGHLSDEQRMHIESLLAATLDRHLRDARRSRYPGSHRHPTWDVAQKNPP